MKMQLTQRWRNVSSGQAKSGGAPRTFRLDHPKSELRKPFLATVCGDRCEVEIEHAGGLGRKLFCHQRLTARDSFPVDVTLRFPQNIRAHPGEIVAFTNFRLCLSLRRICPT